MSALRGRSLVTAGDEPVHGRVLLLEEPLSLWGGLDPQTGRITDQRHPNCGESVRGRVLAMARGRGSSSASSVLLEAVRVEQAPVAILTEEVDGILTLGAAVAWEVYERGPRVVALGSEYQHLRADLPALVEAGGRVVLGATGTGS